MKQTSIYFLVPETHVEEKLCVTQEKNLVAEEHQTHEKKKFKLSFRAMIAPYVVTQSIFFLSSRARSWHVTREKIQNAVVIYTIIIIIIMIPTATKVFQESVIILLPTSFLSIDCCNQFSRLTNFPASPKSFMIQP